MGVLTSKREAFAQYLASGLSQAESYRRAFDTDTDRARTVWSEASRIARDPDVAARVNELRAMAREKLSWTITDSVRWYLARAVAPREQITQTGQGACRHCHGDGFQFQWREPEFMEAVAKAEAAAKDSVALNLPDIAGGFGYNQYAEPHPDCPSCDGKGLTFMIITPTAELSAEALAAFDGVKQTRNGIEILLADPVKCMERVDKLLGFDVDRHATVDPAVLPEKLAEMSAVEAAKVYQRLLEGGQVTAH